MAMTVMNNSAAMLSLGELNKNITEMGKRQKKLSSGMKINSAGDDASSYAISERMRVKLRALDQDVDNVKKGTTLLNVAGGAIDNIVDELRNMKEMAINAANDHNTDKDRATLQKEFEQKMQNIDDIAASTNYNGRYLLNGDYFSPKTYWGPVYKKGDPQTSTVVTGQKLTMVQVGTRQVQTGMQVVRVSNPNTVTGFASAFTSSNYPNTYELQPQSYYWNQKFGDCNKAFVGDGFKPQIVDIDFSGMKKVDGSPINIPSDLDNQGFSILCGGCKAQYVSVIFDASTDNSQYSFSNNNSSGESCMTYTIGIKSVTNSDELEDALFNGIMNAPGKPTRTTEPDTSNSVLIDRRHDLKIVRASDGKGYAFTKGKENINGFSDSTLEMGFLDEEVIINSFVPQYSNEPIWQQQWVPVTQTVTTYSYSWEDDWINDPGNPLIIHHGTKANENLHVFINNMHTDAMGLAGTKIDNQEDALWALSDAKTGRVGAIDAAIEYALGEATNIGAYITRLGFTEDNLVTSNENTQSAESVIRDSDMAKEMTNFTKSSILSQSAQAMLAQANQVGSQALSLLQQ